MSFPDDGDSWQVRALGAIKKHERNQTIQVFLGRQSSPYTKNSFFEATAPIGLLPVLRIGSIWKDRQHDSKTKDSFGKSLRVTLEPGRGEIVQGKAHLGLFERHWALPPDIISGGHFVEIRGACSLNGKLEDCRVLFPCPVVFGQFYAGTSNLAIRMCRPAPPSKEWNRTLWLERMRVNSVFEHRTYTDLPNRHLHICLGAGIEDAAYRHVAWIYHEAQAHEEAESVFKWLAKNPDNQGNGRHLQIGLPFSTKAGIDCHGVWDQDTRTVLVNRVIRCDYKLPDIDVITFDRENDARYAQRHPPGTQWIERPGGDPSPPRKEPGTPSDNGGDILTDPPLGDQDPLVWLVEDPVELFGCSGGKAEKAFMRTEGTTLTPPLSDDEVHDLFGCGEGAYTKEAKPGVVVRPPIPPDATTQQADLDLLNVEVQPGTGFDFILQVFAHLRTQGWHVSPTNGEKYLFDLDPRAKPSRKSKPVSVLAAFVTRGLSQCVLMEVAHRVQPDKEVQRTATILAWPMCLEAPPEPTDLRDAVAQSGGIWKQVKAAATEVGWFTMAVVHQSKKVGSDEDAKYTAEERVEHHSRKIIGHLSRK